MSLQAKDSFVCWSEFHSNFITNFGGRYFGDRGESSELLLHPGQFSTSDVIQSRKECGSESDVCCVAGNCALVGRIELSNRKKIVDLVGDSTVHSEISDIRIVLRAYLKLGLSIARYLSGSYIFVIIDKNKNQIIGVRDHIGSQSLYYCKDRNSIFVSDNLLLLNNYTKATSSYGGLNQTFIVDYLANNFPAFSATIFQKINALPPACLFKNSENEVEIEPYWDVGRSNHIVDSFSLTECLQNLIEESVRSNIDGNSKVAVQLSGGLDSSALLAIYARILEGQRINIQPLAFSKIFQKKYQDEYRDERIYAEAVAKQYRGELHYVSQENLTPLQSLKKYYEVVGNLPYNPFFAIADPLYKHAKSEGVEVLLTGFGGDETVSMPGLNGITALVAQQRFLSAYTMLSAYAENHEIAKWRVFKSWVLAPWLSGLNSGRVGRLVKKHRASRLTSLLRTDILELERRRIVESEGILFNQIPLSQKEVLQQNIMNGIWQHMLEKYAYVRKCYSIRCRHPYLDVKLLDFMASIPVEDILVNGWKRGLFRYAMQGILPDEICWRKDKSVFSLPYIHYIQSDRDLIESLMSDRQNPAWDYIDRTALLNQLDKLFQKKTMLDEDNFICLQSAMALNLVSFIRYIRE